MIECSICKSQNPGGSAYCSECGQRLHPAVSSAFKLHSPLLDSHDEEEIGGRQAGRENVPVHNGLHSPLLDAWSAKPVGQHDISEPSPFDAPGQSQRPQDLVSQSSGLPSSGPSVQSNQGQAANTPLRLHSPVLDGPGQGRRGLQAENLDLPVEEYNSLRSPILAAKVPLPEAEPESPPVPSPAQNSAIAIDTKLALDQPVTIKPAFGPGSSGQASPLTGVPKQFASSVFDQSPLETGDKPLVRSPRQTGHFTKVTVKQESQLTNVEPAPVEQSKNMAREQSLLPKQEEPLSLSKESESSFTKALAALVVLAALGFKIWYWQALGSSFFYSRPFLFDQIGAMLVLLLLLVLILTAKF